LIQFFFFSLLNFSISDLKLIRENAEKEIAAEIEKVKAARLAALATIEAEQVCFPGVTSTEFVTNHNS